MLTAIRNWVIRTMMKSKGETGIVRTLPNKDIVELNTQITAQRLMQNGIDPQSLKNADQVENAIISIESRPKVQEGIKSTGKVFDMEGKEIDPRSKIMGGKEVKETEAEILARLNEENKKGIESLRQKMKKEEARSKRISGNLRYDNQLRGQREEIGKPKLDEDEYEYYREILDDEENMIVQGDETREQLEAMVKEQKDEIAYMKRLYDKGALDPPEDMAQGGRAGFKSGSFLFKGAKKLGKKYKGSTLEALLENPKLLGTELSYEGIMELLRMGGMMQDGGRAGFDNGGAPSIKLFPRARGREIEQEVGPGFKISERDIDYGITGLLQGDKFFGGAEIDKGKVKLDVVSPDGNTLFKDTISKPDAVNFILGMGDPRGDKFQVKTDKDFENMQIIFNKKFNQGGRAGFFLGSGSKFPKGLATLREIINAVTRKSDVIKNPSDILRLSNPKAFNKMLEDAKGKALPKEGIMATDKVKGYQTEMAKDRIKTVRDLLESGKNLKALDNTRAKLIDTYMKEIMRKGNFNEEQAKGIVTELVDIQVGKSSGAKLTDEGISQLENVLKNMETGGKPARDLNADGGRIGFKEGMTRRTFLKIFGGLVSLPIVGKVLAPLKLTRGVSKVPIIKTDNVPGKPEWFDQLVNKVIIEGDDVTKKFATGERQSIHQKTLDDGSVVRVTEDVDDGAIRVEYDSKTNPYEETTQLEYKKPLPDEGAPSPTAEFSAAETGPIAKSDSARLDYEKDIEEFATGNVDELVTDFSKLKEYATGQKPTMREIVEAKKKKDQAKKLTEGDFDAEYELMEKRQGLPFYDEPLPDDFASGGIARMLGE